MNGMLTPLSWGKKASRNDEKSRVILWSWADCSGLMEFNAGSWPPICAQGSYLCVWYIYIYDIYMIYIYINIYICMIYIYIHYESLLCISIEHHDTEKHVQHFLWAPGFCLRTSHVRSTKLHLSAGSGTYIGTLPQQEWLLYLVIW